MEASSSEKNLPDDNVGSDSTLGGCSPLSWCEIVSLAGVITVCIGGVATHPVQASCQVSRFIPAEPGHSLCMVLCLVTIVCIVCMVPVWVPLCMVAGLIFDVPVGTLSVMIGRYFYLEPIRESASPRRHSCLATETVHSSHLQRTTREHFDPNVLGSTEVSAVPAEVVDAKTGVEEPLVVHGVNVPASGPQNNVHLWPTELVEKVVKLRLPAFGTALTVFGEKDRGNEKFLVLECGTTPLVRDDSAGSHLLSAQLG